MENQPDRMRTIDQIEILWRDACAAVAWDIVADAFDITPERLLSKERGKEYVARARQVAMYLLHVECGISQAETGRAFDRDRSSVAYACRRVEDMREDEYADITLDLLADAIKARIAEIGIPSLQAEAEEIIRQKKSVVGGPDIEELPLIRTVRGKKLQVVFLK